MSLLEEVGEDGELNITATTPVMKPPGNKGRENDVRVIPL